MLNLEGKILIVDDLAEMREKIRKPLVQMGFRKIIEANNGALGLDMIRAAAAEKKPFYLVISDINMPTMDGLEMLAQIREQPLTKDTPVLIMTTESEKPTVIRAVLSGISGYVVKPFNPEEIQKKVVEIFKK
jgi:two-component system chemotaxis response regulator CheY